MGHRGPADWATSGAQAPAAPPPRLAALQALTPMPTEPPGSRPPRSSGGPPAGSVAHSRLAGLASRAAGHPPTRPPGLGFRPSVCQPVVGWDQLSSSDSLDLRIPRGWMIRWVRSSRILCSQSVRGAVRDAIVLHSFCVYLPSTHCIPGSVLGVEATAVTEPEKSLTLTELPIYSKARRIVTKTK